MEKRKFKHLSYNDRLIISKMIRQKCHKKLIADCIGCSLGTIYNELKRCTCEELDSDLVLHTVYNPDGAEALYREKLRQKGFKPKLLRDEKYRKYISHMIRVHKYSPQSILFEIKNGGYDFDIQISSVNTIYSAIDKGYIEGVERTELSYKIKQKGRRKVRVQKRISKGTSIEKRPDKINNKEEFGHWEMDCVVGRSTNRKTILALTERKTLKEITMVLKEHNTDEVVKALNRLEKSFGAAFYKVFKSITVDNGSEFMDYIGMEKALRRKGKRTKIYYCHPHCPSERGANEGQNKIIRRFFPKGSDFDKLLTTKKLNICQDYLNVYPRKIFNGRCADDLFWDELNLNNIMLSIA